MQPFLLPCNMKYIISVSVVILIMSCSKKTNQKVKAFRENDTTSVYTTEFVLTDKEDITEVIHEKRDGSWAFYSAHFFDDFPGFTLVIPLGEVIKKDSSVLELADMKKGHVAHRKFKGDKWVIEKIK